MFVKKQSEKSYFILLKIEKKWKQILQQHFKKGLKWKLQKQQKKIREDEDAFHINIPSQYHPSVRQWGKFAEFYASVILKCLLL